MFSPEIIILSISVLVIGGGFSVGALIASYKSSKNQNHNSDAAGELAIGFGLLALVGLIATLICFYNVLMEAGKLIRS